MTDNRKNPESSIWKVNIYRVLLLVVGMIAIMILLALFLEVPVKEVVQIMSKQVIEALVTVIVVGVLIDLIMRSATIREMRGAVTDALFNNEGSMRYFNEETLKNIVRSSVNALNGQTHGPQLFCANIDPYLGKKFNFRDQYQYDITMNSFPMPITTGKVSFDPAYYCLVASRIGYIKYFGTGIPEEIQIAFGYDQSILEGMIGDQQFLFREGIFLDDAERNVLEQFSEGDLRQFVSNAMMLKVSMYDILIDNYEVEPLSRGFAVKYKVPENERKSEPIADPLSLSALKCRIEFSMPYSKSIKHFLVTLTEPTHEPEITFHNAVSHGNIEAITFFSGQAKASDVESNMLPAGVGWRVKVRNWVFPRSGVVFIWH